MNRNVLGVAILSVIVFLVTSCANQKQESEKLANKSDSYESNTLMYWTADSLLKGSPDLVRVANELWSFVYGGENLRHNFDDLLAWGDRCDELLVK